MGNILKTDEDELRAYIDKLEIKPFAIHKQSDLFFNVALQLEYRLYDDFNNKRSFCVNLSSKYGKIGALFRMDNEEFFVCGSSNEETLRRVNNHIKELMG